MSIRLAAIGDLHVRTDVPTDLIEALATVHERADGFVVTGDITNGGRLPEFELAAEVLAIVRVPIVAVLGNHDRRCLRRAALRRILERAGVLLLDGDAITLRLGPVGERVGFAGVGGYGGGFWPVEGPAWPRYRLTQAISVRARREAGRLTAALAALAAEQPDRQVVVLHYSPTTTTLGNEPLMKYWMLGNIELARVIDRHPVDLVLHGHAHLGNADGRTPRGIPVRNVALQVSGGLTFHEVNGAAHLTRSPATWRLAEASREYGDFAERAERRA